MTGRTEGELPAYTVEFKDGSGVEYSAQITLQGELKMPGKLQGMPCGQLRRAPVQTDRAEVFAKDGLRRTCSRLGEHGGQRMHRHLCQRTAGRARLSRTHSRQSLQRTRHCHGHGRQPVSEKPRRARDRRRQDLHGTHRTGGGTALCACMACAAPSFP